MTFLPYGRQSIDDSDIEAVIAVLRGQWLTGGPAVEAFETALAGTLDAAHVVACSSGTAALHLAYMALGLGPGDRIIVPAVTFTASAAMALHCGAEVVFADVDPQSGLLGPEELRETLDRCGAPTPKLLCLVHLNGQVADIESIAAITRPLGIKIVEDACHALGSRYQSGDASLAVGACRRSALTCFSFHPVKTITTAEGGAVSTQDAVLAARLARLRSHGIVREAAAMEAADQAANPWYHEVAEAGLNYRLSDIQCALGISQLRRLEGFVARRRALTARYDQRLLPLAPLVQPIKRNAISRSAWHLYPARIDFAAAGQSRAAVMAALKDHGIATQVHYIPLPQQPLYRRTVGTPTPPGAAAYYRSALSLPLFPEMADSDVDRVVETLTAILRA